MHPIPYQTPFYVEISNLNEQTHVYYLDKIGINKYFNPYFSNSIQLDYDLLKGLCKEKFRAPGAMISKILSDYVDHQARKLKIPNAAFRTKLLNGDSNDDRERSKKS